MKTRITQLLLATILLGLMTVPANAGPHGIDNSGMWDTFRINIWWGDIEMDHNTVAYIQHGFGFSYDNKAEMVDLLPFDIDYKIDGQSIVLKRYNEIFPNSWYYTSPGPDVWWLGEPKGSPQEIWFIYYQTFDAGYFSVGTHTLEVSYYISHGELALYFTANLIVT